VLIRTWIIGQDLYADYGKSSFSGCPLIRNPVVGEIEEKHEKMLALFQQNVYY
jgi:hypothetical protein